MFSSKVEDFVRSNPRLAGEVEAIIRWSSYLLATRKSPVLGELLSSGANLLQLCNDIILRQANPDLRLELNNHVTRLKTFLSAIQSLELFAEIYVRDTFGMAAKWTVITVIQVAKAAIRLILLFVFDDGITQTQSLVPLDRIHYTEIVKLQERFRDQTSAEEEQIGPEYQQQLKESADSKSVVLKSSGRRMRSITESPPKGKRFTDISKATETPSPFSSLQKKRLTMLLDRYRVHKSALLTEKQIYGEVLHITRPVAHLALMGTFGTKSWISYLTSLMMDVSSLYLVRSPISSSLQTAGQPSNQVVDPSYKFNMNERMELGQRASSLLLYLLRSPFFDEYTKQKAIEGLATSAESIPLVGNFIATFFNYIPEWQQVYFRIWSD